MAPAEILGDGAAGGGPEKAASRRARRAPHISWCSARGNSGLRRDAYGWGAAVRNGEECAGFKFRSLRNIIERGYFINRRTVFRRNLLERITALYRMDHAVHLWYDQRVAGTDHGGAA